MNPARSSRSFLALERHASARGWRRWASLLAAAGALFAGGAGAAEPPTDTATQVRATLARLEAHKEALARANAAVVGLQVVAVEDARSVATLGKLRQGSGVLIGDDGLVLTIGYLILEADQVDLVAGDGRRIPARVVAYDLASGFGLVQALAPLGIAPAPLGVSARGRQRRAAAVRERRRRTRPQPRAHGLAPAVLGLLGIPHRRRPLHRAGAHRPQRCRPLQRRRRAGRRRLAGRRQRRRAASGPAMRGNMFVPVDLLKPILAELQGARQLAQQQPRLARPQLRRGRRPGARRPALRRQPGRSGGAAAQGRRSSPSTACASATWRRCTARSGAASGRIAMSSSTSCATARRCACRCMRSTG